MGIEIPARLALSAPQFSRSAGRPPPTSRRRLIPPVSGGNRSLLAAWDVRSHLPLLVGALCKLTPRAHADARRHRPLRIRGRSGAGKGAFVRSGERSECPGRRSRPKEPGRPSRLDDCTGRYHAHGILSQTVPSGHNRRTRPRMHSSIAADRRLAGETDPTGFSPGIIRETTQASAPCWPRRASGCAAQPRS